MATNYPQVVIGTTANATTLGSHANDAAFVSAKGSAAAAGDHYYNSTDGTVHWYDAVNAAWRAAVSTDGTQTISGKTHTTPIFNGLRKAYVLKDSASVTSYTIQAADYEISGNTDTAAQTFTLPAAATSGLEFEIHYAGTAYANAITVNHSGGSLLTTLNAPGERIIVRSNGTTFVVTSRRVGDLATTTAFTPVHGFTGGTPAATGFERRVGDWLHCAGDITFTGVFTGGSATLTIPHGLSMDVAKIGGTESAGVTPILGRAWLHDVGADTFSAILSYNSATTLIARYLADEGGTGSDAIGTGAISTTAPFTWANNDRFSFEFSVPIANWKG